MAPAARSSDALAPFELLDEVENLPAYDLPTALGALYAGSLGFASPVLYANFVSSVDGVVALGAGHPSPGGVISGNSTADRFVMALLRACADTVLLGAGTLRDSPGHRWTPEHVYPSAADDFAALRANLGRAASPRLAVVTATGEFDVHHAGLLPGTVILTSDEGAARLRGQLRADVAVRSLGTPADITMDRIVECLRDDGDQAILTEGGPTLVAQLLRDGLVDELFLTLAPTLLGRSSTERRPGLVDALAFAADAAPRLSVHSVRRHGSHLFLRYGVASTS